MSLEITEQIKPKIDLEQIKRKRVNIAVFGHGNVGSILINQILESSEELSQRQLLELKIFAVANSSTVLLDKNGLNENWNTLKKKAGISYTVEAIIGYAETHNLENLIAIDNTANTDFVVNYKSFIKAGFNLVSSNKIANTLSLNFYREVRALLSEKNKNYLYETNVGAGLPLVDTIKLLHQSGENITRIKGVFSGSLSYLFNGFSEKDLPFSQVLDEAIKLGYTEPDPREDLCGNDVGRKLLILARELDLHCEFNDVKIQNLIPKELRKVSKDEFFKRITEFDVPYHIKRAKQSPNHVLRYIGDLHGDLSEDTGGLLDVQLVSVPKNSMLGQLKGSDSIFEIYTESYGENPIVIQGAGAGAAVTARGVFGDVLRLSNALN